MQWFQARYGWSAAAAPGPRLSAAAERAAAAALRGRAALVSPAAAFGAAGLGAWEAGVRTAAQHPPYLEWACEPHTWAVQVPDVKLALDDEWPNQHFKAVTCSWPMISSHKCFVVRGPGPSAAGGSVGGAAH